jgi:hypothetical protein
MSAAKAKKTKNTKKVPKRTKATKRVQATKRVKTTKRAKAKAAAPASARPFRFTAADTVQVRFSGAKKSESFRVDDMAEATITTLDGQSGLYYQYRLISNDKKHADDSDRCFWFFDAKPVGAAHPLFPMLWQPANEPTIDGYDVMQSCSGGFSTRSVTGYDGSGNCHIVKLDNKPSYRMRLDFNGKRDMCDSMPVTIGKGDVLSVGR